MIQCTTVYVTDVQRNEGVMTVSSRPPRMPLLYRQDHAAHAAANKIQRVWNKFRQWQCGYKFYPTVFTSEVDGAFSHIHGYYPELCATKVQALFRGHKVRKMKTVAAAKIQTAWKEYRLWNFSYNPVYPKNILSGHMFGYHTDLCATKVQALFRGHKARQEVNIKRNTQWIVNNILI